MSNRRKQSRESFWRGFWEGLAPTSFMPPSPFQEQPHAPLSDVDAMRSDWQRIGADFDAAIEKARKLPEPDRIENRNGAKALPTRKRWQYQSSPPRIHSRA